MSRVYEAFTSGIVALVHQPRATGYLVGAMIVPVDAVRRPSARWGERARIALPRLGWLLPLLVAGGLQGSAAGCSESSGPSCLAAGEQCGWFEGSCCAGLHCNEGECR
jgi:hypothetical protein